MSFPITRMRRLRSSESMRSLVRETHLEPSQFILPLFVCEGEGVRREISFMPRVAQMSAHRTLSEGAQVQSLRIGGGTPFGRPSPTKQNPTAEPPRQKTYRPARP